MPNNICAPINKPSGASLRKAVRYKKSSIKATLLLKKWFRRDKTVPVTVLDISSKGICIAIEQTLSLNTKVILNLILTADYACVIPAKVIRIYSTTKYGLVFDKTQHTAVDQIISDATDFSILP